MKVIEEIHASRTCGLLHCGVSSQVCPSLSELAVEFGLDGDETKYREIDAQAARRLVELLLHQDMAYNMQIVPLDKAIDLADRFMIQFGTKGVRYFTNGLFHQPPGSGLTWNGVSWNPVTPATFDTGVLALGEKTSGCLWVEDED